MKFVPITEERFNLVYEKMTTAFPYEERRDLSDQKECLNNKFFNFFEIFDNETAVGFIAFWAFPEFIFIEHIAIDEEKRAGGYGSKTIELVKETYKKPIILEAEAPETEQQIKRIRFYDRLGFKVNSYDYEQPSYHGGEGVPLKILSFPELISQEEFDLFMKRTRENGYKGLVQGLSDDEKIDIVAKKVLDKYLPAFEELAK